jgi:hypothetical protein
VIHKINIAMALIVLFTASVLAQSNSSRIGDDYARAALRVIIYTNQSGITAQRISILLDEADVEASTPAEEASLNSPWWKSGYVRRKDGVIHRAAG